MSLTPDTAGIILGAFGAGVVVGVALDDAWHLYRSSRKDRRMPKLRPPRLTLTQWLALALILAALVNMGMGVMLGFARAADHRLEVTQCENANEARAANLLLWTTVLDPANRDEPMTVAERERLDEFRAWVEVLFAPRDCDDLSKRYEIPRPPDLDPSAD